jgi:CubicO group peptidase (beta-lactamase class C family)
VTLRNLLTHTSGYVYDIGNEDMGKWCEVSGTPPTPRVRRASRFGQVDEGGAAQLARCTAMSVASSMRPPPAKPANNTGKHQG